MKVERRGVRTSVMLEGRRAEMLRVTLFMTGDRVPSVGQLHPDIEVSRSCDAPRDTVRHLSRRECDRGAMVSSGMCDISDTTSSCLVKPGAVLCVTSARITPSIVRNVLFAASPVTRVISLHYFRLTHNARCVVITLILAMIRSRNG